MFKQGDCDFVVKAIYDRDPDGELIHSKAGRKMVKVKVLVSDVDGLTEEIFDYFLDEYPKKKEKLLEAIGWPDAFSPLDRKLINCRGRCVTEWKEYNGKDYLNVTRYLKPKMPQKSEAAAQSQLPPLDDDIPF